MILPGRLQYRNRNAEISIVEPDDKFSKTHDVIVAKALIDVKQDLVPVRVFNVRSQAVTVYKGACVATCEPINSGSIIQEQKNHKIATLQRDLQENDNEVPKHLDKMYKTSVEHLDMDQRKQLSELIREYQDVFAKNSNDLGRTSKVQHEINTGMTNPIRQPARRLPIHQRQEAKEEIEKMLKKGVIEPSSSPWASPIVLVKKKDGSTRFCVDYARLIHTPLKIPTLCRELMTPWIHCLVLSGFPL